MIVENERDIHESYCRLKKMGDFEKEYDRVADIPSVSISLECTPTLMEFIPNRHRARDKQVHTQLQADLVEHLWKIHGGE